ncbi:MAG: hypothetical protein ACHRXM_28720 [Isosphaerales bacterium]
MGSTKRLYYMASRLATKGTPIEDWKLPLVSATTDATSKPTARPEAGASQRTRPGQVIDRLLSL